LFLDGLDEMTDRLRPAALGRLAAEATGLRLVLTSRPDEYRAALRHGDGLPYAAVVDLQPVGPQAAAKYLLVSPPLGGNQRTYEVNVMSMLYLAQPDRHQQLDWLDWLDWLDGGTLSLLLDGRPPTAN
jgi:hypothetical protein